MLEFILGGEKLTDLGVKNLNVQSLAFVGDSVHTLFVRTKLLTQNDVKSGLLHKKANEFVKANGQSFVIDEIIKGFSENELEIYKRARNYKTQSQAKNASLTDYKKATGFEAVIGYLFLTGQKSRLLSLLSKSFNLISDKAE